MVTNLPHRLSLPVRPVRRPHVYEEILGQLQPLILEQIRQHQTALPPERELARALGVSRTSLREAIRILSIQGVLEARPGRGTLIKESNPAVLASTLAALVSPAERHVQHIMEFRKALEPDIAAAAAIRASPMEIQGLDSILAHTAEKVARGEHTVEEDTRFHHALAAATKNPAFVQVVARCMDLIHVTRRRVLQTTSRNRLSWEGHQRIVEAVRKRDSEAAYAAMLRHLDEIDGLITRLRRQGRP